MKFQLTTHLTFESYSYSPPSYKGDLDDILANTDKYESYPSFSLAKFLKKVIKELLDHPSHPKAD